MSSPVRQYRPTFPAFPFGAGALRVEIRKQHSSRGVSPFQLEARFTAFPGVMVIVGHSGAGKTTILRCIAGLCDPEQGRIAIGDRALFDSSQAIKVEPAARRVAFVFQDLALFPHLSVEDNVTYGLRRLDKAERQRRTSEILESFQIGHLCRRFPREISGGEQQRVALARSLVTEPSVLLLDEPLSSLDPRTKAGLIDDLRKWNDAHRIPILYVTHDHAEVLALGDRVVSLEHGRIVTEGAPLDIVPGPGQKTAAGRPAFENLFDATVVEIREAEGVMVCQLTGTSIRIETPRAQIPIGHEVRIGIRAREILVASSEPTIVSECNVISGKLIGFDRVGSTLEARVACGAEFRVLLASPGVEPAGPKVSTEIWMMIRADACHLVRAAPYNGLQRVFVFVCQANTSRSPMAQAICNAELASRFGVPLESLESLGIKAVSAGLRAQPGEPIDAEARQALGAIGVPSLEHRSCNLTRNLAQKAEAIFCMTEQQLKELIAMFPEVASKTYCLHPEADIGNPHGEGLDAVVDVARQIQGVIRRRLDGLGLVATGAGWNSPEPGMA
jgi:molybdate transport system ATP-binding protein